MVPVTSEDVKARELWHVRPDPSSDAPLVGLSLSPSTLQQLRAQEIKLAGLQVPAGLDPEKSAAIKTMVQEAFVFAFRLVMVICTFLSLASAAIPGRMIPDNRPRIAR